MKFAVVILLATLVASTAGFQLFPFGYRAGDSSLAATDDGSATRTIQPFRFYGSSYTTVQIYNNGYMGLSSSFVGGFTPRPFPFRGAPMIASYWADHDARSGSGRTYFRVSTRTTDLYKAAQLIRCAYRFDITPRQVVVATWAGLGYFSRHTDRLNTHQTVMVTDGSRSFVVFLYSSITWTTGDASGGSNGFSGTRARAGLNRGDGSRHVTIPNSGSSAIVNIESQSNVRVPGLYVFRTDPSSISSFAPFPRLFPFGECSNDANLGTTDDGSRTVSSGTVRMYGRTFTSLRIYNNGYLGLGGSTGGFTPRPFPFSSGNVIMVAPYWADVDTSIGDGVAYYRRTTDSSLRSRAGSLVRRYYGEPFNPTSLFIATWSRVGHYRRRLTRRNTFQCVLATDSTRTFAIFLYDTLQWTTGDASGGSNGLGGTVARAGINAGDGRRSITMPGSGNQAQMLALVSRSNIAYTGVHVLSPTAVLYHEGRANLGAADDGSRQVSFSVPFYGRTLTTANICNNGFISLGTRSCAFTPRPFPISTPMVAPYWADADANVGSGRTFYLVTTSSIIRQRVKFEVEATRNTVFNPTRVLIATWNRLGYFNNHQDKLNTFQGVIATDGSRTYTIYIYKDIQWTTGDASGGSGGFGGTVARAGNNGGIGRRHVTLPQSGNQGAMLVLEGATNVRIPGMVILQAQPAMVEAVEESAPVPDVEFQEVDKSVFEAAPFADEEVNSLAKELDNLAEPYIEEKVAREGQGEELDNLLEPNIEEEMEGQAEAYKFQGKEVDIEEDKGVDIEEEFQGKGVDIEEEFQGKGVDIEEEFQGKGVDIEEEFQGKGVDIEEEFQGKGVDIEEEFQGKGVDIEEEFQGKGVDIEEEFLHEGVIEEEFQGKGVDIEEEFQGKGIDIEEEFLHEGVIEEEIEGKGEIEEDFGAINYGPPTDIELGPPSEQGKGK